MSDALGLDVLCIGESMVSLAPQPPARLKDAASLSVHVAGAESNVAMTVAALGARAGLLSRVGGDPFGELVLDKVRAAGVDVSRVRCCAGLSTGLMAKDPGAAGATGSSGAAGTTVHYYRHGSAAASVNIDMLADVVGLRPAVVHLSGVTPALSPSCLELVRSLVEERPVADAIISFDVNYRPILWTAGEAAPTLLALAKAADVVFVGLDEAHLLWQTDSPQAVHDLLRVVSRLVVKNGNHDASEFGSGVQVRMPAPTVDVVEPVGAGDAFAAGWLVGLLRELPAWKRLRLGHLCAAHAMLGPGDSALLPDPLELEAMVEASNRAWNLLHIGAGRLVPDG